MSLAAHFEDLHKQTHAARLGMWVFVASELMFFAALFGMYGALRAAWPDGFREGARESALALGTANTAILLTSSLVIVLAVDAARHGRNALSRALILVTMALGAAFLGIKSFEYYEHLSAGIRPGGRAGQGVQIFFNLYYVMTGLHALHVIAGLGVLGWLARRAPHFTADEAGHLSLELGALYWHFVDIVWLFLWPLFYLIR